MILATQTKMTNNSNINSMITTNSTNANEIQAQFELCVEFRRFINIDLFQRGYYQIRASVKTLNKQILSKIQVELEPNKNNENLSDSMFPSCIHEDFAVSKTFLILYRNEEIILDDCILFKVNTLINVFNMIESFQRLDLHLTIDLWFTENDYNPERITQMQLLCSRDFKVHFDPRIGIHLQMPILFDYFHLSAVLTTIHCTLLTLLPPMISFGQNQRNFSLSAILFGRELNQMREQDITQALMKRAISIHNSICNLLLSAYESLQDHVIKMREYLAIEKHFKLDYVNCKEKLNKLCGILNECNDAQVIDDLANRHIAQCSAENIMLWCIYLDNFKLNDSISSHLALDYHNKRLKRFAETFFVKELNIKSLADINDYTSDNYIQLNDLIRQSDYYSQVPIFQVECVDLDGNYDSLPVIFEDVYRFSPEISDTKVQQLEKSGKQRKNSFIMCLKPNKQDLFEVKSKTSTPTTTPPISVSPTSTMKSSTSFSHIVNSQSFPSAKLLLKQQQAQSVKKSKEFFKKTRKNNHDIIASECNPIQLVSYRKVDHDDVNFVINETITKDQSTSDLMRSSEFSRKFRNTASLPLTYIKNANDSVGELNQLNGTPLKGYRSESTSSEEPDLIHNKLLESLKKELNMNNSQSNGDYNERGIDVDNTPFDCSFKSKVLYESFRGKTNTLTRRKNNHLQMLHDATTESTSSPITTVSTTVATKKHQNGEIKLSSSLKITSTPIKKLTLNEINRSKSLDEPTKQLHNSTTIVSTVATSNSTTKSTTTTATAVIAASSTTNTTTSSSSSSISTQVSPPQSETSTSSVFMRESSIENKGKFQKQLSINTDSNALCPIVNESLVKFVIAKEAMKRVLASKYTGNIYSEFSTLYCHKSPYFYSELTPPYISPQQLQLQKRKQSNSLSDSLIESPSSVNDLTTETENEPLHLVICVHGLDGNSGDLRLIRTYLELALSGARMDFLMSEHNQDSTFADIETMTKQLINEINDYIETFALTPSRISFIGHSLGNLIIRSTIVHDDFKEYLPKLYTYLSLSGPHLGTLYNPSGLINMGMWIMQKWKKSGSLLQLSLKDHADLHETFLYKLSKKPTLQHFKNIILVSSPQDRYVPFHSARIEMCKPALKDSVYGTIYKEMLSNILKPIVDNENITFVRYSSFYSLPSGTSNFIGRAAHIAVLDSELFVEKLIMVSVAKYFR